MVSSGGGGRGLKSALSASSNLCSRCSTTTASLPARLYSSAAPSAPLSSEPSAASPPPPPPPPVPTIPPQQSQRRPPHPSAAYDILSGLILTRPPLLTRTLHPFENAFFFYQKRLEERLNTPFITSIYFRPDTPRMQDWNIKVAERQGAVAKELGGFKGKSPRAWDDELKVGDETSSPERMVDSLLKDAELRVSEDAEVIAPEDVVKVKGPAPRKGDADVAMDVKRLDRAMDRTLYLVVKGKDDLWRFPADGLKGENLHEAAQRVLEETGGVNMNTWIVGRVPVAHVVTHPSHAQDGSVEKRGQKTFFLKGRIMAGQANLEGNPLGYTDFQWLTREECSKILSREYFKGVRNMMTDR